MNSLLTWLNDHGHHLAWGAGLSIALCLIGILATPWLVARIPDDYFTKSSPPTLPIASGHWSAFLLILIKNLIGYALLALGLVMIVLPGPGVLAILIGLLLVDLPGKHRLLRWLISRPAVLKTINSMRQRHGKSPLQPPTGSSHGR